MFKLLSLTAVTTMFVVIGHSSFAQQVTASATSGCSGTYVTYSVHNNDGSIPPGLSASVSGPGDRSGDITNTGNMAITWNGSGSVKFTWNGNSTGTTKSFTVSNPLTVNQASACQGTPFNLTAGTPAGGTLTWEKSSNGTSGWTSVSPTNIIITSTTYYRANYTAPGCSMITKQMGTGVTVTPKVSFSGSTLLLEPNYFQLQPISASVSPGASNHTGNYSWTASVGGVTKASASTSGTSVSLDGSWSNGNTNPVTVTVTASGCGGSTASLSGSAPMQTTPTANLNFSYADGGGTNDLHCDFTTNGIDVTYTLAMSNQNESIINATCQLMSGQGTVMNNGTNSWVVRYVTSGYVKFTYTILSGGYTFANLTKNSPQVTVTRLVMGTLHGDSQVCSGGTVALSMTGYAGVAPTYWFCPPGTSCDPLSSNGWVVLPANEKAITTQTTFRARMGNECGTKFSNTVTTSIAPNPDPILVNGPDQVCNLNNDAVIRLNNSQDHVRYYLIKDGDVKYGNYHDGNAAGDPIIFPGNGEGLYEVLGELGICQKKMPGSADVTAVSPANVYIESTSHTQPVAVCDGVSVQLKVVGMTSPTWRSNPAGLISPNGILATAHPVEGTNTFYADGGDANCGTPQHPSFPITGKHKPEAYADPFNAICSGTTVHIPLNVYGNYPSTTYTWTVTPGVGATNSTAPLPDGSEIVQTLTAVETAVNAIYTITPTLDNCPGDPLNVTIPVKPTPQITVADKKMFSSYDVALDMHTTSTQATVDWTVSNSVNMQPVANGSVVGTVLHQDVFTAGQVDGSFTYTLTPHYDECVGNTKTVNITVFLLPYIVSTLNPIIKGDDRSSTLSTVPTFGTGVWYLDDESLGIIDPTVTTRTPGYYKVLVTREGISAFTHPYELVIGLSNQNLNYIITDVVQKPGVTTGGVAVSLLSNDKVNQTIQYFDDLGRPMENVVTQGSPTGIDVITPNFYDAFGRETIKLLPITNQKTGAYQDVLEENGTYKQIGTDFYNSASTPLGVTKDSKPYSKTYFDASPLDRVYKEVPTGSSWQNIQWGTTHQHYANRFPTGTPDQWSVYQFVVTDGVVATASNVYYDENTLFADYLVDDDSHFTLEFKDKAGRLICKKVLSDYASSTWASTYYVYDVHGNLIAVVPPEAIKQMGLR